MRRRTGPAAGDGNGITLGPRRPRPPPQNPLPTFPRYTACWPISGDGIALATISVQHQEAHFPPEPAPNGRSYLPDSAISAYQATLRAHFSRRVRVGSLGGPVLTAR